MVNAGLAVLLLAHVGRRSITTQEKGTNPLSAAEKQVTLG